jgi:hypothetical protein
MLSSAAVLAFLASALVVRVDFHVLGKSGTAVFWEEDTPDLTTDDLIACSSSELTCDKCFKTGVKAIESGEEMGMN